jgi:hypothetical protein
MRCFAAASTGNHNLPGRRDEGSAAHEVPDPDYGFGVRP